MTETVAQEHGGGEDRGDGVGDSLAFDVGRRSVDGFIDAEGPGSDGGRWEHTQRTGQNRRLVREDVAEAVGRQDDVE